MKTLQPGPRKGTVRIPISKSHLHRLLIADFLGGNLSRLAPSTDDNQDIQATKRCLLALAEPTETPILDCGESGSTIRFMRPIAAALGKRAEYKMAGRLSKRPAIIYDTVKPGKHTLQGDVSSQFATGLLYALPLLNGDSEIEFTTPLQSRGYVDLTLQVLKDSKIEIEETPTGFFIKGNQSYHAPIDIEPELDWSSAAFWLTANHLGSQITIEGLNNDSRQPDRNIIPLLEQIGGEKDMSQNPDIYPTLAIAAAYDDATTTFTKIERLRIKESDRVASVHQMLLNLGSGGKETEATYTLQGKGKPFTPTAPIDSHNDHRIAMSAAIAATASAAPLTITDEACVRKSYPDFFNEFEKLNHI